MVVPEFKCPITPLTLASINFCATVVACLGSDASSSVKSSKRTFLPPITTPLALSSSMAKRAPFSLSLPKCAMAPVSGPTCPILTTSWACATASRPTPCMSSVKVMAREAFEMVVDLVLNEVPSAKMRCVVIETPRAID